MAHGVHTLKELIRVNVIELVRSALTTPKVADPSAQGTLSPNTAAEPMPGVDVQSGTCRPWLPG